MSAYVIIINFFATLIITTMAVTEKLQYQKILNGNMFEGSLK
jgi:hypothetical protein